MRKTLIILIMLAVTLAAQSVHFVKWPTFVDGGLQLVASGKLAGLGQGDVTIQLNANGVASVECTNPGGNVAPGQDTSVATTGSVTLPSSKNGNLVFSLATQAPSIPSSACPNAQWSAAATDVVFSGAVWITVYQGGQIVLQQSF